MVGGGKSRKTTSVKPVFDELAAAVDIRHLYFVSDGTATLKGRFVDGQGHPLRYSNNANPQVLQATSKWTFNVTTTATSFQALLAAAAIAIPDAAIGIRVNLSGAGKLIWNLAAEDDGTVDAGHTDAVPDATYDAVIAAGTQNVTFGRVRAN